jgi:hypothetical protein
MNICWLFQVGLWLTVGCRKFNGELVNGES